MKAAHEKRTSTNVRDMGMPILSVPEENACGWIAPMMSARIVSARRPGWCKSSVAGMRYEYPF